MQDEMMEGLDKEKEKGEIIRVNVDRFLTSFK